MIRKVDKRGYMGRNLAPIVDNLKHQSGIFPRNPARMTRDAAARLRPPQTAHDD